MEELDLKELFRIFWNKKVHILIILAIFVVIGAIYSYIFVTPKYQAETTVILAKTNENTDTTNNSTITTTDITLNQKLISTYSELIRSKNILGEVIDNLRIDKTEGQLKSNVSVSTVKDTELIKIAYTDENPKLAQIITKEIANIFIDKVSIGVYNMNNVQVWDEAELPTAPSNINHTKDIAIFAFIGLVVSAAYVLLLNMLDTTVKSKEDVERKLEVSVLTTIPICNFDESFKSNKNMKKGARK